MSRKKRPSEVSGARVVNVGFSGGQNALEVRDPELAETVRDYYLANPNESAAKIGRATGVPTSTVQDFLRRLEMRPTIEWQKTKKVRQVELGERYAKLAQAAVNAITNDKLEDASGRDLAVISGISTDKHFLLTGQPTPLLNVEDRRKTHELIPVLMAEAKRRGINFEGGFEDGTPSSAVPSGTGKPKTRCGSTPGLTPRNRGRRFHPSAVGRVR